MKQTKNEKSSSVLYQWLKNTVSGGVLLGLGLSLAGTSSVAAGQGKGFKHFTPVSRIAQMPVIRVNGKIDYAASYAKARAASVALAAYVARLKEADMLGLDVIQGIDWKLGGTSETCIATNTCSDHEINEAVLAIPSPEPIDPNDPAYLADGTVTPANTKKANVLDFCNKKYASLALGVAPITGSTADGTAKYVVNGYSHAPALPCEVSIWLDDDKIYVDMLDPTAIFTLFFTDVMFSEEMRDRDFAKAISEMPPQVKNEIKAIIYAALAEFDPNLEQMDKKIGPSYRSMDDVINVVDSSTYDSPYLHMSYTKADGGLFTEGESKAVAQAIIQTLSTHDDNPGVHPTIINADGDTLDSILSPKSSWRSARLEPITIPGKNHIIEACSPKYAKMAMSTGLSHVNALPCEITVKIINGGQKLVISYLDPDFMLKSLFADISDEDKAKFGNIPGLIMTDLQNVVKYALLVNSGIELNPAIRISYKMLP